MKRTMCRTMGVLLLCTWVAGTAAYAEDSTSSAPVTAQTVSAGTQAVTAGTQSVSVGAQSAPVGAQAVSVGTQAAFVGVQTGYLGGNTTYHISQYSGGSGIESELRFPLRTVLAGVQAGYKTELRNGKNELQVSLSWMKNVTRGSGKVEDSDWATNDIDISTVGTAHPGKDIYSESDMRLRADLYDARAVLGFGIGERVKLGPMLGFKHQRFHYDVSNVNQVGFGSYASSYTASVDGKVMTYDVVYDMVYVGVSADLKSSGTGSSFLTTARFGFAPYVSVKDRDDHLLRSKMSTCNTTGVAILASVGTNWKFSKGWLLGLNAEYLRISANGTQNQYFYGGSYAGTTYMIDDEITSSQVSLLASLSYQF